MFSNITVLYVHTYFDLKADSLKKLTNIINRKQENTNMSFGLSEFDMNSLWNNKNDFAKLINLIYYSPDVCK